MKLELRIINKCLWCDEKEIPMNKMLCSMKCLSEIKEAVETQHGKGKCGYDISDVYFKK